MTKTILATFLVTAFAASAGAQSFPVPRPAPVPLPDVAIAVPPVPPAAPPAPMPAPVMVLPDFTIEIPDLSFDIDLDPALFDLGQSLDGLKDSLKAQKESLKAQKAAVGALPAPPAPPQPPFRFASDEGLYDQARSLIERDQYDRALQVLDRVIDNKGSRADAAMYWKAYSLSKLARRNDALTVLADLQKQFPSSAWARDGRALDVEIRQASGQSVSADVADDETKLLALRGLMQNDPETAVPIIEKMLAGNSSVRVKERALIVLSQSRNARAREIIAGVATSGSNPDLRLSAVRYLGMRSEPESQKILMDVYNSTSDVDMKRSILRSFMSANARDRLFAIAKSEKSPELRAVAVQQLGAMRASTELEELYRTETDKDVKRRLLSSMMAANAPDKLAAIARTEKDPELQRMAIRSLGATNRPDATEALRAIYQSDSSIDTKKAVVDALTARQQNAAALVALAKAERNTEMKNYIVQRLATMRSPEARDYMVELLAK